ncbi:calcium-independent phospholipase A2-gamma [Elysia marginata]|uniref:Calcium-independent phospholipase A2-gamma n=1 Tax=Elysia marginata TaxID=1093978 RepID=A0AAV4GTD7_9GAST|nr:calcium-independent phospholipase A2-gamma [Elysia marginata]
MLKIQNSIGSSLQLSCACLSAAKPPNSNPGSCRQNGTFTTTFIQRFRSDDSDKTSKNHDLPDLEPNGNSGSNFVVNKNEKDKIGLASFGVTVPLKIAELNRYLTDTSKKILTSSFAKNPKSTEKSAKESGSSSDPDSFETALTQMNQSIVSFYDTSCATNKKSLLQTTQAFNGPETIDETQEDSSVSKAIGPLFPTVPISEAKRRIAEKRRAEKISRLSLESRTKALVRSLKSAHSMMSKITRLEELCDHLIAHPECVWDAASEKAIPCLTNLSQSHDKLLRGLANQALSLLGYCKPLKSPGIRVLSIDGGGTRALVTIEFLKALERQTNKSIHELFDYVCGVSTGALLAAMTCLYKLPLDRCEELYKECSVKMFTRNKVVGTTKLVWNHGFYDSVSWENILKKEIGERLLVEFARDGDVPKMSAVSALISAPRMTNHMFRTYNPPPGVTSQYPGSCKYRIWEVIRASSAAPGYFESCTLGNEVHEDGGLLTNNPTALAIHESRLLWPNENFHCVISLGTGRFENMAEVPTKVSLKRRISTIVDSATDTEAVHHTLQDLLPARSYFRFNPYLSEEFYLDEIRPDKMAQMQLDAQMYTRRNSYKLTAAAERLTQKRRPTQAVSDVVKGFLDKI